MHSLFTVFSFKKLLLIFHLLSLSCRRYRFVFVCFVPWWWYWWWWWFPCRSLVISVLLDDGPGTPSLIIVVCSVYGLMVMLMMSLCHWENWHSVPMSNLLVSVLCRWANNHIIPVSKLFSPVLCRWGNWHSVPVSKLLALVLLFRFVRGFILKASWQIKYFLAHLLKHIYFGQHVGFHM